MKKLSHVKKFILLVIAIALVSTVYAFKYNDTQKTMPKTEGLTFMIGKRDTVELPLPSGTSSNSYSIENCGFFSLSIYIDTSLYLGGSLDSTLYNKFIKKVPLNTFDSTKSGSKMPKISIWYELLDENGYPLIQSGQDSSKVAVEDSVLGGQTHGLLYSISPQPSRRIRWYLVMSDSTNADTSRSIPINFNFQKQ